MDSQDLQDEELILAESAQNDKGAVGGNLEWDLTKARWHRGGGAGGANQE